MKYPKHVFAAPGWEHFTHEADIGIRGIGSTVSESFEQAAYAMMAVITRPDSVEQQQSITIGCDASDPDLLLVNWLNALVYEMSVRHMLFSGFQVHIQDLQLQATVWGEVVDIHRHRPAVEVKGATLTELAVYQNDNGLWIAQCIVDV